MRDLNYDFKQLCRHNRDGGYATQADREHILDLIADQLHEMGFRGLRAQGFKPKHVESLVSRWLAEELSPGTIKNQMTTLRWVAQKIGKDNIVARTNATYAIPDRVYVTNLSKARELAMDQLEHIRTLCIRISLRLQTAFGPRREESIKIDGDSSWPGGGGPRYEVPHPLTSKPCKIPPGGWRWPTYERMKVEIEKGDIVFGTDERTIPSVRRNLFDKDDQVMRSVVFSYAQTATQEFAKVFGGLKVTVSGGRAPWAPCTTARG